MATPITEISQLTALRESGKNCILFFWAQWQEISRPEGQYHQIFQTLVGSYMSNGVEARIVEAEAVPEVSESLEVSVVPTVVAFQGDRIIGRVDGAIPAELKRLATKIGSSSKDLPVPPAPAVASVTAPPAPAAPAVPLEERLKSLISSAPVMLFMKGSPSAPRCGFSRQIVEILQKEDISFSSFDILTDEEVRQGLKTYSDWPTYPQLYVNNVLIGGLDIVKEMRDAGPLKEQFA